MNNNSVRLLLTKTFLKKKKKNFSTNTKENKNIGNDKNRKEILIGRCYSLDRLNRTTVRHVHYVHPEAVSICQLHHPCHIIVPFIFDKMIILVQTLLSVRLYCVRFCTQYTP